MGSLFGELSQTLQSSQHVVMSDGEVGLSMQEDLASDSQPSISQQLYLLEYGTNLLRASVELHRCFDSGLIRPTQHIASAVRMISLPEFLSIERHRHLLPPEFHSQSLRELDNEDLTAFIYEIARNWRVYCEENYTLDAESEDPDAPRGASADVILIFLSEAFPEIEAYFKERPERPFPPVICLEHIWAYDVASFKDGVDIGPSPPMDTSGPGPEQIPHFVKCIEKIQISTLLSNIKRFDDLQLLLNFPEPLNYLKIPKREFKLEYAIESAGMSAMQCYITTELNRTIFHPFVLTTFVEPLLAFFMLVYESIHLQSIITTDPEMEAIYDDSPATWTERLLSFKDIFSSQAKRTLQIFARQGRPGGITHSYYETAIAVFDDRYAAGLVDDTQVELIKRVLESYIRDVEHLLFLTFSSRDGLDELSIACSENSLREKHGLLGFIFALRAESVETRILRYLQDN